MPRSTPDVTAGMMTTQLRGAGRNDEPTYEPGEPADAALAL